MTFSISISGMFYTMLPIFPAFFWLFLIYTFTASTTLNKLLPRRLMYTVQTYVRRRKNKTRPFQEKWYFVTKIVLTYCEKKLFSWSRKTFDIRGRRPRICKIFEITRTIYSNSERSEQFLVTECFLTCSWRFLRSKKSEQL